jgi:hypothetical protein
LNSISQQRGKEDDELRNNFFIRNIRTARACASKSESGDPSRMKKKMEISFLKRMNFANLALPSCLVFSIVVNKTKNHGDYFLILYAVNYNTNNCQPLGCFRCSYLLNQITGLLIGSLAVSGTRLQRFGGSTCSGLVVTLHGTHKGLSGNPAHPIPFDVVKHLGCLSLHLRVKGIRLGLDCCARHYGSTVLFDLSRFGYCSLLQ